MPTMNRDIPSIEISLLQFCICALSALSGPPHTDTLSAAYTFEHVDCSTGASNKFFTWLPPSVIFLNRQPVEALPCAFLLPCTSCIFRSTSTSEQVSIQEYHMFSCPILWTRAQYWAKGAAKYSMSNTMFFLYRMVPILSMISDEFEVSW